MKAVYKWLLPVLCLVPFLTLANQNTFFGKVLEVDGHNVMTVADGNGELRFLSFAYISTPVRHEPYFTEVNTHLQSFIGQWYQFTIARYGRNSNVKPVLMRDTQQKSVNADLVKAGLAMVNIATNPPPALIDQGYKASKEKIGLWGQAEKFNPLERTVFTAFNLKDMLDVKEKHGLVPYMKVESTMTAYPVVCGITVPEKRYPIALTAHVARNEGYTVKDNCDDLIN